MKLSSLNIGARLGITLTVIALTSGVAFSLLLSTRYTRHNDDAVAFPMPSDIRSRLGQSQISKAVTTGSMQKYLPEGNDRKDVLAWLDADGNRKDYYQKGLPVFERRCIRCHGDNYQGGGIALNTYTRVLPYARFDARQQKKSMTFAHIHLFGVGFIVVTLMLLLNACAISSKWRILLMIGAVGGLLLDVAGWVLASTHISAAYISWGSGIVLFSSIFLSAVAIIVDLWKPGKNS